MILNPEQPTNPAPQVVESVELGKTYRDIYTGFQGVAVEIDGIEVPGSVEVLGGLPLVTLQPIDGPIDPNIGKTYLLQAHQFGMRRLVEMHAQSEQ